MDNHSRISAPHVNMEPAKGPAMSFPVQIPDDTSDGAILTRGISPVFLQTRGMAQLRGWAGPNVCDDGGRAAASASCFFQDLGVSFFFDGLYFGVGFTFKSSPARGCHRSCPPAWGEANRCFLGFLVFAFCVVPECVAF